jgi:hypothetical protein
LSSPLFFKVSASAWIAPKAHDFAHGMSINVAVRVQAGTRPSCVVNKAGKRGRAADSGHTDSAAPLLPGRSSAPSSSRPRETTRWPGHTGGMGRQDQLNMTVIIDDPP